MSLKIPRSKDKRNFIIGYGQANFTDSYDNSWMEDPQFLDAINYSFSYSWNGSGSLLVEGTNKGNICFQHMTIICSLLVLPQIFNQVIFQVRKIEIC